MSRGWVLMSRLYVLLLPLAAAVTRAGRAWRRPGGDAILGRCSLPEAPYA